MEKADVIIIGAGPAGLEAARHIAEEGYKVILLEKEKDTGGKLRQWDKLFPDFTSAHEVLDTLQKGIEQNLIEVKKEKEVVALHRNGEDWIVIDQNHSEYQAKAILVTTGYDFFDARRKEEYGYGIYPNVITSAELEEMLAQQKIIYPSVARNETPRIAFIQCVGSRDEKMGNHYCSRNCCICAVKQSIEVKEILPDAEVFCFYMDLRMFGKSYEELYREAQQKYRVNFVRGRVSEISPTIDQRVLLKAEDTLLAKPLRATFDLVVLMVGMEPSEGTKMISSALNIQDAYGYLESVNNYTSDNETVHQGVFIAGTCKKQLSIPDVIKDADAAAFAIRKYLTK